MESSFAKTELLICWHGEALADCSLPGPSNRSLWWSKRWACVWLCFYFREGSGFLRTNVPLSTQVYEVTCFSHFWPDLRELGWELILASVDFLFFPSKSHYENGHMYKNVKSIHIPITMILPQCSDITYLNFYIFFQGEEGFHPILGICKQV